MRLFAVACVLLIALAGCGGGGGSGTSLEQGPAVEGFAFTSASDVAEGQPIDVRFTCDGEDVSPTLAWEGVPERTVELALVLEDPDAPGATFTHWLAYGLDPLIVGLTTDATPPGWETAGENDFGDSGYGGPCPPEGEEHRYVFRLLALDEASLLDAGADRAAFDDVVEGHVLAEARLVVPYQRQG